METAVVTTLELAKQDERGRRISKKSERAGLIAAFRSSGLTQRAFARREGINPFTFCNWLRKERSQRLATAPAAQTPRKLVRPRFLEVGIGPPKVFALEVALPGGVVVRGSDVQLVASLIQALR